MALTRDIRYALRQLHKNPAFSAAAVLTLALGIGANTAIFSVVDAVLLKPLPLPQSDRLVVLSEEKLPNFRNFSVSPPNFMDYRDQNHVFAHTAAYNPGSYTVTGQGDAVSIRSADVSADFFAVTGISPALGRAFSAEEMLPGGPTVVIIGHQLWQTRFGGDPQVLNRSLTLDGTPHRIVGVMPAGFHFPTPDNELWVPLVFGPDIATQRGAHYLSVLGRLRPGATVEAANQDIRTISKRLEETYPRNNKGWAASVESLTESVVGRIRPALLVLLGAVGLVALIGCVNVANLLLARSTGREGEIAVRTALGADRGQLLRQLFTESLLISALGGILAVLLAGWGLDLIVGLGPRDIPRLDAVRLDGVVLGFTAGVVVLAAVLFGLWPAFHATRPDLTGLLSSASRRGGGSNRGNRVRSALVVAEVALALTLLVGAGLLIRSFVALQRVDAGFDPDGIITFDLSLPDTKYPDGDRTSAFYEDLLARTAALPGVRSSAAIFGLPLTNFGWSSSFKVDGAPVPQENEPSAQVRLASRNYFRTLSIPLRQGRLFDATDRRGSPQAILASESAAKRFWPNGDAIGHLVHFGARPGPERIEGQIVGIVGDVRDQALGADAVPTFYGSVEQVKVGFASIVVRAGGARPALVDALREQVRGIDPDLPVMGMTTLSNVVGDSISRPRFYTLLLAIFAAVALALAAVGVYGVFAYLIAQRTREIGIRIALGADPRDVLAMVIGGGMRLVAAGLGLGLVATLGVSRLLRGMLFQVKATDPVTMIAVSLLLSLVAFAACYLPARRAARVDPIVALRAE